MIRLTNTIGLRLALVLGGLSIPSVEREEGQTLAEYALILALIAVVVLGAVFFLGGQIRDIFSHISTTL
jgi:pilus assembly protein Flp/PilA